MIPFSWMWGDPAEVFERMEPLQLRMAKAEKEMQERERRIKARRIRRLTKLAKGRLLKGQSHA